MDNKALIKKLESELRQARQNFKDGKGIPLEEFDWGMPMHVAESKTEYRVQNEAWTPIVVDPDVSSQINSFYRYIVCHFANEPAAYKFKHIIKNKLAFISTMPKIGTSILVLSNSILDEFLGIRRLTAKRYMILYEYHEDVDLAYVSHIFHQTQDYGKIFE